MRFPQYTESDIRDKGSELFQDSVFNEEVLDLYFRGFISREERNARLDFLEEDARRRAVAVLDQEHRDGAEDQQAEYYGDSGVS